MLPAKEEHMQATTEQLAVVEEFRTGKRNVAVSAVAGSGKTTTIMLGLASAWEDPTSTLLLAFNKKNADELKKRAPAGLTVSTLNGLGHRGWSRVSQGRLFLDTKIVGNHVSDIIREQPDPLHQEYLQLNWAHMKNLVAKAKTVGLIPKQFSYAKGLVPDTKENWEMLADKHNIDFNDSIYNVAYQALVRCVTQGLAGGIDFDDQLYLPVCFQATMQKYSLIVVDEAQDLSEIQHELILRSLAKNGRIVFVGDPRQAIYGFRGAAANSMEILSERLDATWLPLTVSFRCSHAAAALAKKIVPELTAFEGNKQGKVEYHRMNWKLNELPSHAAILCRNVAPLIKLGMEAIRQGVPAHMVGRDIGAPLLKACKDLSKDTSVTEAIISWREVKVANSRSLEMEEHYYDTAEALLAVTEVFSIQSKNDLESKLQMLFSRTTGGLTLSTVHRAKGMEWDVVYILDRHRMPAKYAVKAAYENPEACSWMLEQEKHLQYIAYTRTKNVLGFIDYQEEKTDGC